MITHIVTLIKQRIVVPRAVFDEHHGREIRAYSHTRSLFDNVEAVRGNNFLDLQTFYFDDEKNAKMFAAWAAVERPGYETFVAKVSSITTVEIGAPIVKTVTDKGVMPE